MSDNVTTIIDGIVVPVSLGAHSYDIHIGSDVLTRVGDLVEPLFRSHHVMIVTDSNVSPICLDYIAQQLTDKGLRVDAVAIPAGEGSKTFTCLSDLVDELLDFKPDRHSTIIALGGGVIGDLAGFAASILMRGIPFIQIPTSLLAQVDSSVGGKTGINTYAGKNLVGSFYQPKMVIADTDILKSLPERELKAGYAEIVKYAALGDVDFFSWLEANGEQVLALNAEALQYAVAHSCRMKANIVAHDEREKGVRALLNLGHTFGHALEAEAGYDGMLLHGEAVAIGMCMAFNLSVKLGHCPVYDRERFKWHIDNVGLPTHPKAIMPEWNVDALMEHMLHDKKNSNNKITCILVNGIGRAFIAADVSHDMIHEVWQEALA